MSKKYRPNCFELLQIELEKLTNADLTPALIDVANLFN